MIYNLQTLSGKLDRAHEMTIGERLTVEALIAIAERLPQDTEIKERLRAIVQNSKCSDYKSPSELEAAIMALADELEETT